MWQLSQQDTRGESNGARDRYEQSIGPISQIRRSKA